MAARFHYQNCIKARKDAATKGAVAAASENAKNTNKLRNLNVLKADEYCQEQ
ncbi:hypothetical protein Dsin_022690 [Dipteronia sinensis]|uniref:Uncharacterized protein n=1 Tax=Dipteronia sinensis TaxID=43782 RepID=A0AAE0A1Z7_9ROSI|nr:hypothetical protein Dsin_022690 [Dipteronia sinensis]